MSNLPIISADERLKEKRGIKGCIFGKSGIGKTSLLWTLDPKTTLFFDLEAGDLAVEGWQGYYPFKHFGGGNMIPTQVISYMKEICALPCRKIFHNAQYDLGWLQAMGIQVNGEIVDTMVAAAIVDENRWAYNLNSLAKDYLGEIKAETDLKEAAKDHGIDPKAEMWKLPAEHVGFYAEQDARLTLKLW
jgi:DNA polymerase I-like protein with 3'-5' exonuclease and polymerase domains